MLLQAKSSPFLNEEERDWKWRRYKKLSNNSRALSYV